MLWTKVSRRQLPIAAGFEKLLNQPHLPDRTIRLIDQRQKRPGTGCTAAIPANMLPGDTRPRILAVEVIKIAQVIDQNPFDFFP